MKKLLIVIVAAVLAVALYVKQEQSPHFIQDALQFSKEQYSLILVNKEVSYMDMPKKLVEIPQDIAPNVVINSRYMIDEQLLNPLTAMLEEAKQDDVQHFIIISAYRSFDEQQNIYYEKGSSYALPAGHSEHETGLSLDIGSTIGLMETSEEGSWLANNAHRFGFILRYPEHKESITKISYEPWHFRYVGLPHSLIMYEKDMVLEEYISFVKEKKEMTKKINGVKYTVQYADESKITHQKDSLFTVKSFSDGEKTIFTSIEK